MGLLYINRKDWHIIRGILTPCCGIPESFSRVGVEALYLEPGSFGEHGHHESLKGKLRSDLDKRGLRQDRTVVVPKKRQVKYLRRPFRFTLEGKGIDGPQEPRPPAASAIAFAENSFRLLVFKSP